jgi:lambda family phage tail tape measure protein
MASNISVAITVDNKQYIANIKAADSATQKFATDTQKNLGKVNTSFDTFTRRVGGLRTALAGLAFGAVGSSALQLADSLQDLSNSSGIAVSQLLELKNALVTSGGEADSMPNAINTLLRSIDEAAGGSIKAQNAFMKLGVTLGDLGSLSEKDLMIKTLEGIAKLPSATERATAMMQNFGKSFKTVDAQELLDKLRATAGEGDKYAASIKRAAELNDKLATAQGNLKLAFLEAFSGPIQKLVEFGNKTTESTAKMETLITVVKALGVALVTAFSASVLIGFVASIGTLLRGLSAITAIVGLGTLPAWLIAASGAAARFIPALRAIALLASAVIGIFAANQIFDDFASVAKNALQRIGEAVLILGADLLNFVGTPLQRIMTMLNGGVDVGGMGQGLQLLADKLKTARLESEAYQKSFKRPQATAGEGVAVATGNGIQGTMSTAADLPVSRPIDNTATQNAVAALRDMTAEYEKQQRLNLSKIDFETRFIGLSEESKAIAEAQVSLAQQYSDQQDQLIKKRENLTKDEREQGVLAKEINEQIKKNAQAFNAQFEAITKSVTAQQTAKKLEEDRLYFIDLQTKSMNTILDIQANIANFSRSEDDRKIAALQRQIKLEEDAAVKREQQRLGATPLGAEAEAAIREKVRKSTEGQLAAQLQLNAATKAESARLFVQDLQNTAIANTISLQAELAKLTMTADQQRIKDLQTQNELLIQQEIAKRNALLKPGESIAASEIAAITAQVTAANSALIASTQALIDKSREWSTGWEQAFVKYKDDAENAATQSKTYFETFTKGFEDAFVKFVQTGKLSFKDLANSMIADFARIQAKKALLGIFGAGGGDSTGSGFSFGTLFKGIGSIFGFANGGSPPVNRPSIVGERGPELFIPKSAGTVVPNGQFGGGNTNNTEVTYNIQAMDASSFRSMLARDPEFIHNVAEQGRRQLPIRSRR